MKMDVMTPAALINTMHQTEVENASSFLWGHLRRWIYHKSCYISYPKLSVEPLGIIQSNLSDWEADDV